MTSALFKKKPDADRRSIPNRVWTNAAETAAIQHAAAIRKLSVGEYFRRAALGRRADVRYEMDIVLQLSRVVQTIRALHVDLVERGIEPTAEAFRPVVREALDAILRIQK